MVVCEVRANLMDVSCSSKTSRKIPIKLTPPKKKKNPWKARSFSKFCPSYSLRCMPRGEFSARLFSPTGSTGTNVSEGAPTATGATGADAVRREGCGPESRMPSFGGLVRRWLGLDCLRFKSWKKPSSNLIIVTIMNMNMLKITITVTIAMKMKTIQITILFPKILTIDNKY